MERFDVLVVGSGSGMSIADAALNKGYRVALVEKDPLGGTCLNRGCIPSKMVIYPADVIQEMKRAEGLGIKARIEDVDFSAIMERARRFVGEDRKHMEESVKRSKGLTHYHVQGEFVDDYRMRVGDELIEAKNIFLVSGARPHIPPIKGIEAVKYLTYFNLWGLTEAPRSIIIVGGGYIACEMAHFFNSVGSEVTILSRSPKLLRGAEPEISDNLTQALRSRMSVQTDVEATEVREVKGLKEVSARSASGEELLFKAEAMLIAAGLRGNADILNTDKTGVKADPEGYIKVNEYYETTKPKIWAFGDAIGKAMYKHVANREAELVWHAFDHNHKQSLDYDKVPFAVFSWPQVASVGITEEEAGRRKVRYLVGVSSFADTAYGAAMGEEDGFVKLILEEETYKILGCHIIGPHAAILIHEIITAMNSGDGSIYPVVEEMHIHPSLSEVVNRATWNLQRQGHNH